LSKKISEPKKKVRYTFEKEIGEIFFLGLFKNGRKSRDQEFEAFK